MKKYLVLLIILMVPFAASLEQDPFVSDGEIKATIVLGDNADVQDIISGTEVSSYLQSFATTFRSGLSVQESDVDFTDGRVYIIIGLKENVDYLSVLFGDSEPKSAYIGSFDNVWVISGSSQDEVSKATEEFISGTRNLGLLESSADEDNSNEDTDNAGSADNAADSDESLEETVEDEIIAVINDSEDNNISLPGFIDEKEQCAVSYSCDEDGDEIIKVNSNCKETVVEICPYGCSDGKCTKPFFSRLIDWLIFWN